MSYGAKDLENDETLREKFKKHADIKELVLKPRVLNTMLFQFFWNFF